MKTTLYTATSSVTLLRCYRRPVLGSCQLCEVGGGQCHSLARLFLGALTPEYLELEMSIKAQHNLP